LQNEAYAATGIVAEAYVAVLLLNVMGSAAVASAVVAGVMTTRLSRELAGLGQCGSNPSRKKLDR
jgi:H+/gluconate symporter-like permease